MLTIFTIDVQTILPIDILASLTIDRRTDNDNHTHSSNDGCTSSRHTTTIAMLTCRGSSLDNRRPLSELLVQCLSEHVCSCSIGGAVPPRTLPVGISVPFPRWPEPLFFWRRWPFVADLLPPFVRCVAHLPILPGRGDIHTLNTR